VEQKLPVLWRLRVSVYGGDDRGLHPTVQGGPSSKAPLLLLLLLLLVAFVCF